MKKRINTKLIENKIFTNLESVDEKGGDSRQTEAGVRESNFRRSKVVRERAEGNGERERETAGRERQKRQFE